MAAKYEFVTRVEMIWAIRLFNGLSRPHFPSADLEPRGGEPDEARRTQTLVGTVSPDTDARQSYHRTVAEHGVEIIQTQTVYGGNDEDDKEDDEDELPHHTGIHYSARPSGDDRAPYFLDVTPAL
jgi:hypothetical protein